MNEWNLFPMVQPRPNVEPIQNRDALENAIAQQVSDLLGSHGEISSSEIDNSGHAAIDSPQTFLGISLEPVLLEDDGELEICQFPRVGDEFTTYSGAHSITKIDDYDRLQFEAAVWDPAINVELRIHTPERRLVEMSILHELYDALIVRTTEINLNEQVNSVVPRASEYPIQVIEPAIELLGGEFNTD